jgi:hypothetical protein
MRAKGTHKAKSLMPLQPRKRGAKGILRLRLTRLLCQRVKRVALFTQMEDAHSIKLLYKTGYGLMKL